MSAVGEPERILFQSRAFRARLDAALTLVAGALARARRPYIAFSGGKDSTVVCALVHALRPDVPLHWSDDELEYPEVVDYMARLQQVAGPELLTITYGWATHAGWFRPWRERPFWREPLPETIWIGCDVDDWRAAEGYDLVFLGTRAAENRRRRDWFARAGPLYRVRGGGVQQRCCPIWDWSADDVWALIAGWELPYCAVYDRYDEIGVPRHAQRVGPLPLARRSHLEQGWPDLLVRLEQRYGRRWPD